MSKNRFHFQLSYSSEFIKNFDIKPVNDSTETITLASAYPMTKVEAYIYARYLVSQAYPYIQGEARAASFAMCEDSNLRIAKTSFKQAELVLTHLKKPEWVLDNIIDIDEIYPIGYLRGYAHRKGLSGNDKDYSRAIGYDIDIVLPSVPMMYSKLPDDDIRAIYSLDPTTGKLEFSSEKHIPNLILKYQPLIHAIWRKMKADDIAENFKDGHSYGVYPSDSTYVNTEAEEVTASVASLSNDMIDTWLKTNIEMNC